MEASSTSRNPGNRIDQQTFNRIWEDARALLTIGVKHNAIITVDGARLPHAAIVSALIYSRKKFVLDAKESPSF